MCRGPSRELEPLRGIYNKGLFYGAWPSALVELVRRCQKGPFLLHLVSGPEVGQSGSWEGQTDGPCGQGWQEPGCIIWAEFRPKSFLMVPKPQTLTFGDRGRSGPLVRGPHLPGCGHRGQRKSSNLSWRCCCHGSQVSRSPDLTLRAVVLLGPLQGSFGQGPSSRRTRESLRLNVTQQKVKVREGRLGLSALRSVCTRGEIMPRIGCC